MSGQIRTTAALLAAAAITASSLPAQAIRAGFDGFAMSASDDGFVEVANVGFAFKFYGAGSSLFINNNGNVSVGQEFTAFTPGPLVSTGVRMMAPFFADVDTRATGAVSYGQGTVGGRTAFGVNWLNVGYFDSELVPPGVNRRNSFQLVLINRSDVGAGNFDFEFNYGTMQWESGDAAGGVNGLGGDDCARVGWTTA